MFEKVNPSHPDKIADRIAGAIVDLAYKKDKRPKVAVEVLIGHGKCHIITETSVHFRHEEIREIVDRIVGEPITLDYKEVPQDIHLSKNQSEKIKCGDNGIFKGVVPDDAEKKLSEIVKKLYKKFPTDGKFVFDENSDQIIACQSNGKNKDIEKTILKLARFSIPHAYIVTNPLGEWTGGTNVDTGATNRKLGSDMGRAVTGGGLHGKDLSKADVSMNIMCHILAKKYKSDVESFVAIGDEEVEFRIYDDLGRFEPIYETYSEVVSQAGKYIKKLGGFEKLAEWGLI